MQTINNLAYSLEINFVNNSGIDSSISVTFHDNGLKIKSIRVGDTCITEETINGRVLSGRLDNSEGYCGYRYDYQNGENLLNINPDIPINTAVSLINKNKSESGFLTAELVFSSIVRKDYRVVILNEGSLNITRTVSAENEEAQTCCLQESVTLTKSSEEECCTEKDKTRIYTIAGEEVNESQLNELTDIIAQNPQNYKELIEIKNQVQKQHIINEDKTL